MFVIRQLLILFAYQWCISFNCYDISIVAEVKQLTVNYLSFFEDLEHDAT